MTSSCKICGKGFEPPERNPTRQTCSRSCAVALSWGTNREQRLSSIRAERSSPESRARQTRINLEQWAGNDSRRAALSERNRREWADPARRAARIAVYTELMRQPERREFCSQLRTAMWRNPDYRARCIASMMPRFSDPRWLAKISEVRKRLWRDPVYRAKTVAGIRRAQQAIRNRHAENARRVWAARHTVLVPVRTFAPKRLPLPPIYRSVTPVKGRDAAEMDAIARFLAERGATRCPTVAVAEVEGGVNVPQDDVMLLREHYEKAEELRRERLARKPSIGGQADLRQ